MSGHLVAAFAFLLWTLLAAGVAVHAHDRGRSWALWTLVVLLTGVLGLLVYGVVVAAGRESTDDDPATVRVCPDCSTRHEGTPDYCSDCGTQLDESDETGTARVLRSGADGYCSNCRSQVELDADDCWHCDYVF